MAGWTDLTGQPDEARMGMVPEALRCGIVIKLSLRCHAVFIVEA
jgi:hypothetical protein